MIIFIRLDESQKAESTGRSMRRTGYRTMNIIDKIKEPDLKIIGALYNNWKESNKGDLNFDADSCSLQSVVSAAGLTENEVKPHLQSLQGFDFVEFDGDRVKLLPSGIKYARGQFDNIH